MTEMTETTDTMECDVDENVCENMALLDIQGENLKNYLIKNFEEDRGVKIIEYEEIEKKCVSENMKMVVVFDKRSVIDNVKYDEKFIKMNEIVNVESEKMNLLKDTIIELTKLYQVSETEIKEFMIKTQKILINKYNHFNQIKIWYKENNLIKVPIPKPRKY